MKIFSLAVILAPPNGPSAILSQASDLSSFSFFERGSVGEFMTFFSKTVADRTQQGQRQTVQENKYNAHVYNRGGAEQLAGASLCAVFACVPRADAQGCVAVIVTDQEYPVRPAFSLLSKMLDDFVAKVPQSAFNNPGAIGFPDINNYLSKYQDPRHADNIMRVQAELDETKIILVRSIFCLAALNCPILTLWHTAAQDDGVCAAAWGEARRPCRSIPGAINAKQDVLQNRQEGAFADGTSVRT
jgi:hypothetical protein